tara:strand:- start:1571 stop:2722 length:1152 start_codon:yes stop_codon:yes gene_type:complete
MLEQAIIDAAALKEAAVKNAETLVLEKFSNQIKDAVESLLEQETPMTALDSPDEEATLNLDDNQDADSNLQAPAEESSVMEHIPLAATSKDDSQIEIPLDKLMEELAILNNSFVYGGDSHNISEDISRQILGEDEDLEEMDEDLDEMHCGTKGDKKKKRRRDEDLDEDLDLDEDVELDEEQIKDLAEQLVVDLAGPNKGGWAGMPESLIELAEEELLAIEQDSKVKEQKALMRRAVQKLSKANESLTKKNKGLSSTLLEAKNQFENLKDVVITLKQKLDETNLSNAKLLYQNKALTSDSLNERQKDKLVEAVSNAETIEEAKVIFETLQNTVGSTSRKSQPKSLSEAVQKSSSIILSASKNSRRQEKASPTLDRWKFLAGIDK